MIYKNTNKRTGVEVVRHVEGGVLVQRGSYTVYQLAAAVDPTRIDLSPEERDDIINKAYGDYAARQTRNMKKLGPKYHTPDVIDHSICGPPIER